MRVCSCLVVAAKESVCCNATVCLCVSTLGWPGINTHNEVWPGFSLHHLSRFFCETELQESVS